MQTLKIECSLNEQELDDIARGLGWQETITVINPEDRSWTNEPNTQSHADYIVEHFTREIAEKVKTIFVAAHKQDLLNEVNAEITQYSEAVGASVASKLTSSIE